MRIIDETANSSGPIYHVIRAAPVGDYRLQIDFSDGVSHTVDFYPFLTEAWNPVFKKYLEQKHFKNFVIKGGNLNWNNYEMIFPVAHLHSGVIRFIPPTLSDGSKPTTRPLHLIQNGKTRTNGKAKSVEGQLGVKLRLAREAKGMTQQQIANKLKVTPSTISRIENHADDIRLSMLRKYAKVLGRKIMLEILN